MNVPFMFFSTVVADDNKQSGYHYQRTLPQFEDYKHLCKVSVLNYVEFCSREDICGNPSTSKCETLGLAELGTMCDKASSCALVQDNGLSAAFTIAHELGHV